MRTASPHAEDVLLVSPDEFAGSAAGQNTVDASEGDLVLEALLFVQDRLGYLLGHPAFAHLVEDDCAEDAGAGWRLRGWRHPEQTLDDLQAIEAAAWGLDETNPLGGTPLAALAVLPEPAPPSVRMAIRMATAAALNVESQGPAGVKSVEKDLGAGTVRVEYVDVAIVDKVLMRYADQHMVPAV